MTEFHTIFEHDPTKGEMYTITLKTDNKKHFEYVQEAARKCIDGVVEKPNTTVTKNAENCARCVHGICPYKDCKDYITYLDSKRKCRCITVMPGEICPYFKEVTKE